MNSDKVLSWFTGKAREKAKGALAQIHASLIEGSWVPGAARGVRAALTKHNVAQNYARLYLDSRRVDAHHRAYMAMMYGSAVDARQIDWAAIEEEHPRVKQFVTDMGPVWDAIAALDAALPKPVFTTMNASPTVSATLKDLGLDSETNTARIVPLLWKQVEKNGIKRWIVVGIDWPPGTVHGQSRFATRQGCCQACGHRIKNSFNWIPMVVEANGAPHSLWVGRDCAKTLFGIDVKGNLELAEGLRA